MTSSQVFVGTSPVLLVSVGSGRFKKDVHISTLGNNDIYVGPSGVTATNGLHIEHDLLPYKLTLYGGDELHAVRSAGETFVSVLVAG